MATADLSNADRVEEASLHLCHVLAMTEVLCEVNFEVLSNESLSNFSFAINAKVQEAKDLIDGMDSRKMDGAA